VILSHSMFHVKNLIQDGLAVKAPVLKYHGSFCKLNSYNFNIHNSQFVALAISHKTVAHINFSAHL
jgi:hypothetical protein